MRPARFPFSNLLIASLLFFASGTRQIIRAEEAPIAIKIADAATHVTAAQVNLSVENLKVVKGELVGNYSISVPLLKSKFEKGRIILPLSKELQAYIRNGGTVTGSGIAEEGSQTGSRKIDARFSAYDDDTNGGSLRLTIDTGERVMVFDSSYQVSGIDLAAD